MSFELQMRRSKIIQISSETRKTYSWELGIRQISIVYCVDLRVEHGDDFFWAHAEDLELQSGQAIHVRTVLGRLNDG